MLEIRINKVIVDESQDSNPDVRGPWDDVSHSEEFRGPSAQELTKDIEQLVACGGRTYSVLGDKLRRYHFFNNILPKLQELITKTWPHSRFTLEISPAERGYKFNLMRSYGDNYFDCLPQPLNRTPQVWSLTEILYFVAELLCRFSIDEVPSELIAELKVVQ